MYDSALNTLSVISADYIKDIIPDKLDKSFTIDVRPSYTGKALFSKLSVSNDYNSRCIYTTVKNFRLSKDTDFTFNIFAKSDKLGFFMNDNPQLCYTANADNFCTRWNKSIYSKLYKIPSFVPDDLTYDKISALFSAENLTKAMLALSLGKIKLSAKELINNTDISDIGAFPLYYNMKYVKGRLIRVSISGNYIQNTLNELKKSSSKADLKIALPYLKVLNEFINNLSDNHIVFDIVLYNNKIYSAETALETNKNCINIKLDISDNIIRLSAKDMKSGRGDKINYTAKLIKENSNQKKLIVIKDGNIVLSLDVVKKSNILSTADLAYINYKSSFSAYSLSFSSNVKAKKIYNGKNIYALTVSDLYSLMKVLKYT